MKSIRTRLTLFSILLVAICLAVMGLALRARIYSGLLTEIDRQLDADSRLVSTTHPNELEEDRLIGQHPILKDAQHKVMEGSRRVVEVLRNNHSQVRLEAETPLPRLIPVVEDRSSIPVVPPADEIGFLAAKAGVRTFHIGGVGNGKFRTLSTPVRDGGKVFAVVQAVRSLAPIDAQMSDLDRGLATVFPLGILVAALSGALMVRSTMRPLRKMTESAKLLAPDLSAARLPTQGGDEFADLAKTFNEALNRTAAAFESQRQAISQLERFTGDAGHELKTPLGAVKGSATYLLHMADLPEDSCKSVRVIDKAADRMGKLIDDLLLLARRDGGQPLRMEQGVDLATVIEETLEELEVRENLSVVVNAERLNVEGDRGALKSISTNLLLNAFAYARSTVSVTVGSEDGYAYVEVSDDGEGIASEHIGRLGERFYRPDASRSRHQGGTGLGLAIVKSLCEAHGGDLQIQSEIGKGSCFKARVALKSPV